MIFLHSCRYICFFLYFFPLVGPVARPRSGCSEASFNFDTPRTPHFDQSGAITSTMSSSVSDSQLRESNPLMRNGNLNNLSSSAFNFNQPENQPFNISEGFPVSNEKVSKIISSRQ